MENVEDVYVLSPMQEMMLLHDLSGARDDVLFNQFRYQIHGKLDGRAFRKAWETMLQRHPALRTAFLWEGLKQPLQVVQRSADLAFVELDLTGLPVAVQQPRFDDLCREDRQQGFSLSQAPLLRLALIKIAEESFYFVWSSHHLILDRWCIQPLLEELFELYGAIVAKRDPQLEAAPSYRDYIAWIQSQSREDTRRFWRSVLKGFDAPSRITEAAGRDERQCNTEESQDLQRELSSETTAALRSFAAKNGLTLSVVVQAAWALVLCKLLDRADVVFGTTVSGRPPSLSGVERTLGSFINNLPVRVRLSGPDRLADWLRQMQLAQHRRSTFEHIALADLHACSDLPPEVQLFDSLLIWLAPVGMSAPKGLAVEALVGSVATAYPFTLTITEGERLALHGICHRYYRTRVSVESILTSLESALTEIAGSDGERVLSSLKCVGNINMGYSSAVVASEAAPDKGEDEGGKVVVASAEEEVEGGGREGAGEEVLAEMLAAEWRSVLGREDFSQDDGFFDMGGDSLSAIRLHARVENATRKKIPLLTLFQSPTVRGMAKLVQDERWPLKPSIVVPLRRKGAHAPLFCIASPEVNAVGYAILAQHLGEEQPVYVLQSPPEMDRVRRLSIANMPQLAGRYLHAMKSVQATGPYNLLGMCSGGHLALEMARQLNDAGERVAFLGILDTWAFFTISRWFFLRRLVNRLAYYRGRLRELKAIDSRARWGLLQKMVGRRLGRSDARAGRSGAAVPAKAAGAKAPAQGRSEWLDEYGLASKAKELPKYHGVVTLFSLGRKVYWRTRDADMGWSHHADEVKVERLAATSHQEILRKPHVEVVARELERLLSRDQTSEFVAQHLVQPGRAWGQRVKS